MKKILLLTAILILSLLLVACDAKSVSKREDGDVNESITGSENAGDTTGSSVGSNDSMLEGGGTGGDDDSSAPTTGSSQPVNDSTADSGNTSASGNTATTGGTTETSGNIPDIEVTKTVTIMFNTNKAPGDEDAYSSAVSVEVGGKLASWDFPYTTYEGYTLKGWAYDPYGDNLWHESDRFDVGTILFAVWEKNSSDTTDTTTPDTGDVTPSKVGIVFNANGGSVVFDDVEIDKGAMLSYSSVPNATR